MAEERDFRSVDPENLTDITQIRVDQSLSGDECIRNYLEQVGNPHLFRVGDVIVKCSYAESGPSLNEQLRKLIRSV